MHWAVRNKKEPMLEASEAEIPVTSQAQDPHAEQEAPRVPSHDAMPSSSKYISECSQSNEKHGDRVFLMYDALEVEEHNM